MACKITANYEFLSFIGLKTCFFSNTENWTTSIAKIRCGVLLATYCIPPSILDQLDIAFCCAIDAFNNMIVEQNKNNHSQKRA